MDSTRLDVKFLADERELYDELQMCTDEEELLIVMSDIQAHFVEELKKQQDQIRERYAQLAKEKDKRDNGPVDKSAFFKPNPNISSMMTAGITSTVSKLQARTNMQQSPMDEDNSESKPKLDLSIPLLTPRTKYGTYRLEAYTKGEIKQQTKKNSNVYVICNKHYVQ
ncbi:hypothetical protein RFI_10911 [Reticulomyxa filosa]|uniref:Uncharacterized protein n=1 Tax=Reticulomyxa filosa TaxID=46433 RepID=X6NJR4_RETFI|nr:hypothetical protein RFI_10911 [Reticulomyxa filosa]|eukprot:ETO26226.1 hypothetical protein RFI_10911 [Reticulomyxa filosa]